MIKRVCQVVLLISVAAVSTLAGGCGDEGPEVVLPSGPITIPIRVGTWSIQEVATYTGADSCVARDSTIVDTTQILCSFDIGDTPSDFFITDCTVDTVGDEVVYDCTIRINLGICLQLIDLVGSGTVTDTTYDLSGVLTTRLIPAEGVTDSTCNYFYGNFIDACSTWIESEGTWLNDDTIVDISEEGDTTWACGRREGSIQMIPLQDFMQHSALEDLWRR